MSMSTAAKGNGQAKPRQAPVVPPNHYTLREEMPRGGGNTWIVRLPAGVTKEDLPLASTWSAAGSVKYGAIQRFDRIEARAHDESFWAELLVLEDAKIAVTVLVRSVLDLPPRGGLSGNLGLPHGFYITLGTAEEGLIVSRDNPDGSKQILTMGRDNPSWRNDPEQARDWIRNHASLRK
jgi:hypothetical protein